MFRHQIIEYLAHRAQRWSIIEEQNHRIGILIISSTLHNSSMASKFIPPWSRRVYISHNPSFCCVRH